MAENYISKIRIGDDERLVQDDGARKLINELKTSISDFIENPDTQDSIKQSVFAYCEENGVEIYDDTEIKNRLSDIDTNKLYKKYEGNQFNKNDNVLLNSGFYADGDIGGSDVASGYFISNFIEVESKYMFTSSGASGLDCICLYDKNKSFVQYVQYGFYNGYLIPSNVKYVRLMSRIADIDTTMLSYTPITEKTNMTYKGGYRYVGSLKDKNSVVLDANGDGDFKSVKQCLETVKANGCSSANPYYIYINKGYYPVCWDFTSEEISNATYTEDGFVGVCVTDGMHLIGMGDKSDVILWGELATENNQANREAISTLNLKGNCSLKNLTICSKYLRYPIHDDFTANENTVHNIENCDFICYLASDGVSENQAYGLGTRSGSIVNFKNCTMNPHMIYHTNASFSNPSTVNMENCEIAKVFNLWDFNSGVKNKLNMKSVKYGCLRHSYNGVHDQYIEINGSCNTHGIISCSSDIVYHLDECTIKKVHYGAIYGACVEINNAFNDFDTVSRTITPQKFFGILLENVGEDNLGLIQTTGYISSNKLGISADSLSIGDLLTPRSSDSRLEKTSNRDVAVAVVAMTTSTEAIIKILH